MSWTSASNYADGASVRPAYFEFHWMNTLGNGEDINGLVDYFTYDGQGSPSSKGYMGNLTKIIINDTTASSVFYPNRIGRVDQYTLDSGWQSFGYSNNLSNIECRTSNESSFYFYGSGPQTCHFSEFETAKSGSSTTVTGNVYIYYRKIYSVSFDLAGGTWQASTTIPSTIYAGIGYSMPNKSPTRHGYSFVGWKHCNGQYTDSSPYNGSTVSDGWVDGRTDKWTAVWSPNNYTISFEDSSLGGGSMNLVNRSEIGLSGVNYFQNGQVSASVNYGYETYTSSASIQVNNEFDAFKFLVMKKNGTFEGHYIRLTDYPTSSPQGRFYTYTFTKDFSFQYIVCGFNGSLADGTISWNLTNLVDNQQYTMSVYLSSISPTYGAFSQFKVELGRSRSEYSPPKTDVAYTTAYGGIVNEVPRDKINVYSNVVERFGYSFLGWFTAENGGTRITSSSINNIIGVQTLYAHWEIKTFSLTVNYYSALVSNSTSLNISASGCVVGNSSIALNSSTTISHTYSATSSYTITFTRASTSYNYYLKAGGVPTTSSDTNSTTYSWIPTGNSTINVYVYQRYSISFSANGGTGTLPSTVYKIHGTSGTIPTNVLTRTGYKANGWNTNSSGSGTNYTTLYSSNANIALYANWTPQYSTVRVQTMTSDGELDENGEEYYNDSGKVGDGGSVVVSYKKSSNNNPSNASAGGVSFYIYDTLIGYEMIFTPKPNIGFVYMGFRAGYSGNNYLYPPDTNGEPPENPKVFIPEGNIYVYPYFKKVSTNKLKYDTSEKYFYFEDGEYPQTYVGTTMNNTLTGAITGATTPTYSLMYNIGTGENIKLPVYTYGGQKYAALTSPRTQTLKLSGVSYTFTQGVDYFFKVEPIRWRVSEYGVTETQYPSGWSNYGTYKENFVAVSDKVLGFSAMHNGTVSEGWSWGTQNVNNSEETRSKLFEASLTNSTNVATEYKSINYSTEIDVFGNVGQQDKVTTKNITYTGSLVASTKDINANLTDKRAKASDMVGFYFGINGGDYVDYWTRNLGDNLNNGLVVTRAGVTTSRYLNSIYGVRLSLVFAEGSRI